MKLKALPALAVAIVSPLIASAQDNGKQLLFQDTETHISQPELRVFVNPMVCDLSMKHGPNSPRTAFETEFTIKSLETLSEAEFSNLKKRALYQFTKKENADIIVEPLFNSYVLPDNNRLLIIEITGFPANYTNFRALGKEQADLDMVRVVYPAAFQEAVESKERK